jgi:F-type H+-transporting ATPase subunit epsilon
MADTLELEIVTPDRLVVKAQVEEVQVPAKRGYIGVLPGHAPLITELAVGEVSYRAGSNTERISLAWGFAEVLPNKVTILAETAERAEDIDVERAEASRSHAEKLLQEAVSGEDYDNALAALQRANTRLEVAGKK